MQVANDHRTTGAFPDYLVDQLILAAEAAIRYRISAYRDRFKLTDLQYRLMMHIENDAPASLGQLAALVNRDVAQVSRTIKSLVDAGLVTTTRKPGQLCMAIELSPDGHKTLSQMGQVGEEWEAAVRASMSPRQIDLASHALEQVYGAARQILEGNGGKQHQ